MEKAVEHNDSQAIIFRILGKKLRTMYRADITSVPDLDMMYNNIKYSVTRQNELMSSVEKNKLILSELDDYVKRYMDHKLVPSLPADLVSSPLTELSGNQVTSADGETTVAAYDKLMAEREAEHSNISANDKNKIDEARKWLQSQNSRMQIHETPATLGDAVTHVDGPDVVASETVKVPKKVRFESDTKLPKHQVAVANSVQDNIVSFNDNLGLCDTLQLDYIILMDKTLVYDEPFGIKREMRLSQLPYIVVDVHVNGTMMLSTHFFQTKKVDDTILFETNLVLSPNDLVTEIKLVIRNEQGRALDMRHELEVETMIHAPLLTITDQYDKEMYGPEYFYVRVKSGDFKTGDTISTGQELCSIVGTCTTNIRRADNIVITNLTDYEKHNTIILRLNKAFTIETRLLNTSRNPKCAITTA